MSDLFLGLGLVIVGIGLFVWLKQWVHRRRSIPADQFYDRVEQLVHGDEEADEGVGVNPCAGARRIHAKRK